MARSHGQITTAIWSDPEFLALKGAEQLLYLQLVTQADVSLCGVVAATIRRWAALSSDGEPRTVVLLLRSLADRRFLVIDETTEEVFIRSFMRHDGVARKGNVMKSALRAARTVRSRAIRTAIAKELARLDVTRLRVPDGHEPVLSVYDETMRQLAVPVGVTPPVAPSELQGELFGEPHGNRSADPSGEVRDEPFARSPEEEEVEEESSNAPVGFNSSSVGAPERAETKGGSKGRRIPDDFAITDAMRAWAAEKSIRVDIDRETEKFIDYWRSASGARATKRDWAGTWRVWMRTADERLPQAPRSGLVPTAGARPSTTDQRIAQGMSLVERWSEAAS